MLQIVSASMRYVDERSEHTYFYIEFENCFCRNASYFHLERSDK